MNYITLIEQFEPNCEQEAIDKSVILQLIKDSKTDLLTRDSASAHITSSGLIFNYNLDKVLMVHHNIYNTWAWTGGHADGDGDLLRVALKEAAEETGVDEIVPLSDKMISLDILPVWGHLKRGSYVSSHLHLSVAYALLASESSTLTVKEDENSGVRWIALDDLKEHVSEDYLLGVYRKIIKRAKILYKR